MRIIAVVGSARSGTTVLRQTIGSTQLSYDLGEVFHGQVENRNNFFGYVGKLSLTEPRFHHPVFWPEAWFRFCEVLGINEGAEVLCVDAKMEYFPFLMRDQDLFIHDDRTSYLFVERKNLVAQTFSFLSARHSNIWSAVDEDSDPALVERFRGINGEATPTDADGEILVDAAEFLRLIEHFAALRARQRQFAARVSAKALTYETMFDAQGFVSDAVLATLADLTGMAQGMFRRKPILKKQGYQVFLQNVLNLNDLSDAASSVGLVEDYAEAVDG